MLILSLMLFEELIFFLSNRYWIKVRILFFCLSKLSFVLFFMRTVFLRVFCCFVFFWLLFQSSLFVSAWDFEAEYLHYLDLDGNKKIDTLWIDFGRALTGSIDLTKIQIYSSTGGLSSQLIDTYRHPESIILSGALQDAKLVLTLREQDLKHTDLFVSEKSSSQLRLRFSWEVGIQDLVGNLPLKINYSKSFDKYTQVGFWSNRVNPPSKTQVNSIPKVITPPIIEVQSGLDSAHNCQKELCMVNLKYTPKSSQEQCEWSFWEALVESGAQTRCNPWAFRVPEGENLISLKVFHLEQPSQFAQSQLLIHHPAVSVQAPEVIWEDLTPVIVLQTKLNNFMSYSWEVLVCEGKCKLNFDGSQSEWGKWSEYVWDFWDGTKSVGQNPTTHTFDSGSYQITLSLSRNGVSRQEDFPLKVIGVDLESIDDFEVPKSSSPKSFKTQVDSLPLWQKISMSVGILVLFLWIWLFILKQKEVW